MIQVELTIDEFGYDVRSLIQAFYPEQKIQFVTSQTMEFETEAAARMVRIEYEKDSLGIEFYDKDGLLFGKTQMIEYSRTDETGEIVDTKLGLTMEQRKEYKNILKRMLYTMLEQDTGRTLPWGTLTGIRPTKIPMKLLEDGYTEVQVTEHLLTEYLCDPTKAELSMETAKKEYEILSTIDYENGYSLYIGIPFCPTTCLYCSFTSYSIDKYADYVEDYLKALYIEIEQISKMAKGKKLITVYFGGGTPTTLTAVQLKNLILKVKEYFPFEDVREFTVEAGRPDSITRDKLEVLKEMGVTRISINPQTMNQKTLDLIGRKHTVEQIQEAFALARETGHDNINMDLILGLHGETREDVVHTLQEIDALQPDSVTVHTLAIKRAARLNVQKDRYLDLAATDTIKMLKASEEYTKRAGYQPYYLYRQKNMTDNLENIGYSKEDKEGIYNILIMEEKHTILALGAGAASKFVFEHGEVIERSENVKSVKDYIERVDEMIERKRTLMERNFL